MFCHVTLGKHSVENCFSFSCEETGSSNCPALLRACGAVWFGIQSFSIYLISGCPWHGVMCGGAYHCCCSHVRSANAMCLVCSPHYVCHCEWWPSHQLLLLCHVQVLSFQIMPCALVLWILLRWERWKNFCPTRDSMFNAANVFQNFPVQKQIEDW